MSTVKQLEDGAWQVRWRDLDGNQRAKRFRRKVDAKAFQVTTDATVQQRTYVDPKAGRKTVAEWWGEWSATCQWRPGTRERYAGAWRNQIEPRIGGRQIASVRPSDLAGVLAASGLSPSGQGLVKAVLSAMFRAAVDDKLIASSPVGSVKVPKMTVDEPRPLTDDEIDQLVAACDSTERAWVLTGLGTGVRISEGLAIRTEKIDFLRRELHVDDQARTPASGPVELAPVKNGKPRVIPLADGLLEVLGRHVAATVPEAGGRRDGLLFPGAGGGLRRRGQASARFAQIVRRSGLDAAISWHNLRDTAATGMLRAGLNPAKVAQVIGNTVPVLLTRYAGVLPADDDRAREALGRITARAVSA